MTCEGGRAVVRTGLEGSRSARTSAAKGRDGPPVATSRGPDDDAGDGDDSFGLGGVLGPPSLDHNPLCGGGSDLLLKRESVGRRTKSVSVERGSGESGSKGWPEGESAWDFRP